MTTASKLVDEITGEEIPLDYDDTDPLSCKGPVFTGSLDIGFPTPREVGYNLPNANGFNDLTEFWGERVVAWSGWVAPNAENPYPAVVWDKIRALAAPARRPWLHFIEDGWAGWRRMQLRGDNLTSPLTREFGPVIAGTINWKATNGGATEAVDERHNTITPSGASTGGTCFDSSGGCFTDQCGPEFTEGYIAATTIINNNGNVIVYPIIIFYGDVTDPTIKNLTTGQEITLEGNITENAEIWVDTQNRTIRENNDPNLNRLSMYDFTKSNWMYLAPGENKIDYRFSSQAGGRAVMSIRDRWI